MGKWCYGSRIFPVITPPLLLGLLNAVDSVDGDLSEKGSQPACRAVPCHDDYEISVAVTIYTLSLSSLKMNAQ
jgi:hypothetical protein